MLNQNFKPLKLICTICTNYYRFTTRSYSTTKNDNSAIMIDNEQFGIIDQIMHFDNEIVIAFKRIIVNQSLPLAVSHVQKGYVDNEKTYYCDLGSITNQCVLIQTNDGCFIIPVPFGCLYD